MRSDPNLAVDENSPLGGMFPIEQNSGISHSGHERNHLFLNLGGKQFADIGRLSGVDSDLDGRAFGILDFDRDGWDDFVVMNANTPSLQLYRNRLGERAGAAERGRFVALRFVGGNRTAQPARGLASRDGYGALVTVEAGGRKLVREYRCGEGLAAQNSRVLRVGLAGQSAAEKIAVRWPSGRVQETRNVPAGRLVTVYEEPSQSPTGQAFVVEAYAPASPPPVAARPTESPVRLGMAGAPGGIGDLNVLTTMATWCPKCKAELPQVAALRAAFPEQALTLRAVSIDLEDTPEKLRRYVEQYRPAYRLMTEASRDDVIGIKRMVEYLLDMKDPLPATVITDRDGEVVWSGVGVPTVSEIKKLLARQRGGGGLTRR